MIEFALIAALSADTIIALVVVLGFIAVHTGALQGTASLKAVPPGKRKPPALDPPPEET